VLPIGTWLDPSTAFHPQANSASSGTVTPLTVPRSHNPPQNYTDPNLSVLFREDSAMTIKPILQQLQVRMEQGQVAQRGDDSIHREAGL
jgi:hypothetical protein